MADQTLTDPFAAQNAPRAHPLNYPGVRPTMSAVITEDAIWEIRDRDGRELTWASDHVQRLPNCRVALSIPEIQQLGLSASALPHLSSVLEEAHGVTPDGRIPVLAVGSNASPAQMRHKFLGSWTRLIVPSIRVRVPDVRVGFCSFVSSLGYIPATPIPAPGAVTEMVLQLLDEAQLLELDRTERTAYRRVWLDQPILLETGEELSGAYIYVAQDGYLADESGPWVMAASNEQRPADVPAECWFPDQRSLLERVCQVPELAATLGETPEEVVSRGLDYTATTHLLRAAGLVHDDNPLYELDDCMDQPPKRYGALFAPRLRTSAGGRITAIAGRSHDYIERSGRSVVRVGAEIDRLLGEPINVEVVSAALKTRVGARAPRVLATVYREPHPGVPDPRPDEIEVDNVLRMALGIEAGEEICLRPVEIERARWADRLLGPPNTLTLRVTLADPATTERDVCLMNALSLQLLGVNSGDYVVLEGGAGADGEVKTMAVKAFELPSDVLVERQRVSSGTWGARFPGVRETLGISPDIPIIFIDASTRARLGIGAQQLGTVRARPARLQQFGAELREMMLLMAVALIGLLTVVPSGLVAILFFGLLVIGTFALTMVKLRRRLSHPRQKA